MAATAGSVGTAVAVCADMTEGIINRFRTMAISRTAVLTGHVVGSTLQTLVSIVFVVLIAVADRLPAVGGRRATGWPCSACSRSSRSR